MKKRVVRRRNGTSKASLTWFPAFASRQMKGLLQQIIGKSHRLCPGFLLKLILFGFASVIEIGLHSPFFDWL